VHASREEEEESAGEADKGCVTEMRTISLAGVVEMNTGRPSRRNVESTKWSRRYSNFLAGSKMPLTVYLQGLATKWRRPRRESV
jgi:hypothetical protein